MEAERQRPKSFCSGSASRPARLRRARGAALQGADAVGQRALALAAVGGELPLHKLFSKDQRAFFAAHAPEAIELDDLSVLGPIHVLKLKFSPEGYGGKLAVELWLYPDGSRILELSTKCKPNEAFQVAAESRAYLAERGVNLFGEQQTKTRTALEFFSREMAASEPASR